MNWIRRLLRLSALAALLCFGATGMARAEGRLALVIGNSAYKVGALANPRNDAALMASILREVGFEVTTLSDATKDQMKQALLAFSRRLRETGAVGLFYYAGHGVQLRGENFVVPVDADIQNEAEVEFLALNVNEFLAAMERTSNQVNIVILDACRNNPFARSFRSGTRGLATVDAPRGTYIAYATAPGQVALDGDNGNSPYATALAAAIKTPGLTIEDTFKKARRDVLAATSDQQVPWETSSITGSFYFSGAAPAPAVATAPVQPGSTPPAQIDTPPPPRAASAAGAQLPMWGASLGGIVRAGPGVNFAKVTSLREGDRVRIVHDTGQIMNGYNWFQIKFRDRNGYLWGGIMCSEDPLPGILSRCKHRPQPGDTGVGE